MKKILIINLFILSFLFAQEDRNEHYKIMPSGNFVSKIIIDNTNVWLLTEKGLSSSSNRGLDWNYYDLTELFDKEARMQSFAVKNNIVICGFYKIESSEYYGEGLAISTDYGKTWKKIEQPIDNVNDTLIVYGTNRIKNLPILNTERALSYDLDISDDNTIWAATFGSGLRKTKDFGKTWEKVLLPPDNLDSIKPENELNFAYGSPGQNINLGNWNHIPFSVKTIGKDTVLVGTHGGFNISIDSGNSWNKITYTSQASSISGDRVLSVNYNAYDKSLWLVTLKNKSESEINAVSMSKDFGKTWYSLLVNKNLGNIKIGFKNNEAIVPTEGGLYRSNDYGKSWIEEGKIFDKNKKISINTDTYYAAASVKKSDNTYDIWVGSNNGSAMKNETLNSNTGDWNVFFVSKPLKTITSTYAFPNPFNPTQRSINIKYAINKPSSNVTIRIMDFGMNLVRTIIQNSPRTGEGEKIDLWDGRDDFGRLVNNGVYFYRIDVDSDKPIFGKIIVTM